MVGKEKGADLWLEPQLHLHALVREGGGEGGGRREGTGRGVGRGGGREGRGGGREEGGGRGGGMEGKEGKANLRQLLQS